MDTIKIKQLSASATLPTRSHPTDAGLDIYASDTVVVHKGTLIPTGIAIDIPKGYEGQIRPRSGVSSKTNLRVVLGTVDSGYTGEIKVIADHFTNDWTTEGYRVDKGDKIAQLVIQKVELPTVSIVDEFDGVSERGVNGFGSTGY